MLFLYIYILVHRFLLNSTQTVQCYLEFNKRLEIHHETLTVLSKGLDNFANKIAVIFTQAGHTGESLCYQSINNARKTTICLLF